MKWSVVICSRSGTPERLKKDLENQYLKPDEIIEIVGNSLTAQRNKGVKESTGDLITFLDDDLMVSSFYLYEIKKTFTSFPYASAVTGKVIAPAFKSNIWHNLFARLFLISYPGKGLFLSSGFPQTYSDNIDKIIGSEVLHGCNMTIRRDVFNEIKFNETMEGGMYGEDDWFSWDLSRMHSIIYNPFAFVYDMRDYPKGNQRWKTRCQIINLIKRYKARNEGFIGKVAFWWSLSGFIILKIAESIIYRDLSIMKGLLDAGSIGIFKRNK